MLLSTSANHNRNRKNLYSITDRAAEALNVIDLFRSLGQ